MVPMEVMDLRHFKVVMMDVLWDVLAHVKQTLHNWDTQNRIIAQDRRRLITPIQEAVP